MRSKPRILILTGIILLPVFYLLLSTPVLSNLWAVVTDHREFQIPAESSILTFRVNEMNPGSGGWWLYAEDRLYFYAHSETSEFQYYAFPKAKVADCIGFRSDDPRTWCPKYRMSAPAQSARSGLTQRWSECPFASEHLLQTAIARAGAPPLTSIAHR